MGFSSSQWEERHPLRPKRSVHPEWPTKGHERSQWTRRAGYLARGAAPGGQQVANLSEKQKRVYIMATVTGSKGQKARVKTMIDSGNTLDIGVTISDRFRKKMGLKYANQQRRVIGIANQKGKLIQLG